MKKVSFLASAALLCATVAFAQGGPPRPHHEGFGMEGPGFGMHAGKVVAGAPYSATLTNSSTQTLADGNVIQRTSTGSVARDSQGRTYEQITTTGGPFAQNGPVTMTFISDPVAGYAYTLNSTTKVATRHPLHAPRSRNTGNLTGPSTDVVTGRPNFVPPANVNRVESDLGSQVVGGVTAAGKTVTHTIPAGIEGNTQPLVSTNETWISPDLQIPVLAKRSDPRFGQSTYALSGIQRAEPAAALFAVPSGYTVQDAPALHGSRGGGAVGDPLRQ